MPRNKAKHRAYDHALSNALFDNDMAKAEALLAQGASANAQIDREPLLNVAARMLNLEAVRLLLSKGASTNAQDGGRNGTALMSAVWQGDRNLETMRGICKALLECGADPNIPDVRGRTALMYAVSENLTHPTDLAVIEMMINAGADVNAQDRDGNSVLMWALEGYKTVPIVRLLLEHGARVSARNARGQMASDLTQDSATLELLNAAT